MSGFLLAKYVDILFCRSDKKEASGNVSNGTVELTMNNTEMTDM